MRLVSPACRAKICRYNSISSTCFGKYVEVIDISGDRIRFSADREAGIPVRFGAAHLNRNFPVQGFTELPRR